MLDAAEAAIDAVADSAIKAVGTAGQRLIRIGEYLVDKAQAEKAGSPTDDSGDSPRKTN